MAEGPASEQPAPRRSVLRRAGIAALLVAVAVTALAAAAVAFRRDLAAVAIRRGLADAGVAPAALAVQEADLQRLVVTDLRIGQDRGIAVRRLGLASTPGALLEQRIDRIDVQGLDATIRLSGDGAVIEGLEALPPADDVNGSGGWTVAAIAIEDAAVTVEGPVGARLNIDGEVFAREDTDGYRGAVQFNGVVQIPADDKAEISGSLDFTTSASQVNGTLAVSARLGAADERVQADVSGAWDRDTGIGEAKVTLQPVRFAPGRLQPQVLAPSLALPVTDVNGRVAASGRLTWNGQRLRPDLRIRLDTVSMQAFGARLQDIDGAIRITGFAPLQASSMQAITIGRIEAGVPITDVQLRFDLDDGRRLHITRAAADLLGGRVDQADGWMDLEGPTYRGALDVAGLDLQALLDLAELEAATATGEVSGRIPILFEDGALGIDGGVLATEQPGVLRYTPGASPAALQPQGQGQGLGLALQALENFHYESLQIKVDGGSGRGWTSSVSISGKNPDFMEGYPFVFNINLSGDLDRVVLSGLLGVTLPDRIQDRLNQR
ncbi:MAG: YdbH domain-containing protein [Rhodospirillales bacterium]|nr:YdbH domain-containing protein [Rhodospirillales bacterium]